MTLLGKYELLAPLGEGATSEVYRARDTALGREVALKILKPSLVADASAFERFAREAQAAAGLFHPNIATVLDMGEADGRYFIAMRYFKGQSLDKTLKERGPLSWDETLRMVAQIGSALDHAHQQGFLHRDVKPGNIIRAENGDFILTDFGLTRAMMSTGLTSHTGAVLGTPAYIAPEVWNGEQATSATDQYALACVVYECLTGQVLFTGNTPPAVMKKIFDGPRLPSSWPSGVPQGIGNVLMDALNERPVHRYGSLSAFLVALELIPAHQNYHQADSSVYQSEKNDTSSKVEPVSSPTDASKKKKQHQTSSSWATQPENSGRQEAKKTTLHRPSWFVPLLMGVTMFVFVGVMLAGTTLMEIRKDQIENSVILATHTYVTKGTESPKYLTEAQPTAILITAPVSTNGSNPTNVPFTPVPTQVLENIFSTITVENIGQIKKNNSFPLENYLELVSSDEIVSFSPDGQFLSIASGTIIYVWNLRTGDLLHALMAHREEIYDLSFSPDSKILASSSRDSTICVWSMNNGKLIRQINTDVSWSIAFSPVGKTLASSSPGDGVLLWNINNGEKIGELLNPSLSIGQQGLSFSPNGDRLIATGDVIYIWYVKSLGSPSSLGESFRNDISAYGFTPDGKFIVASAGNKGIIYFWDEYGRNTLALSTNENSASARAFSPDGRILVAIGYDYSNFDYCQTYFFDASKGLKVHSEKECLWNIFFAPDGTLLYSLNDGMVSVWGAKK